MRDTGQSLIGLQIMRGIAAALVLWHHSLEEAQYVRYAASPPDWLIRIGAAGVDIFFVISGFIMMYTNFAEAKVCLTPARFLRRRFVRIYPLYWACCGLVLALHAIGLFSSVEVAPDYVANALLLLPLRDRLLLSPAWTLVYEVYFYALFTSTLALRSAHWSLWGTSTLLGLFYLVGHWAPTSELRRFLSSEISFEFCGGLLLGFLATRVRAPAHKLARFAWVPASVAALVATCLLPSTSTAAPATEAQRLLIWGVPATLIVLSAALWRPALHRTLVRCASLLGDASYAIYLTHTFVMISYAVVLRKVPWVAGASQWPMTTAVCLAALVFGVITHLTVERALLRTKRVPYTLPNLRAD